MSSQQIGYKVPDHVPFEFKTGSRYETRSRVLKVQASSIMAPRPKEKHAAMNFLLSGFFHRARGGGLLET